MVLGLLVYVLNFFPTFVLSADLGREAGGRAGDAGTAVAVAVLAALLAGLSLLPKAKTIRGMVAAIAVLGALLVISEMINTPTGFAIGWAMWPLVGSSVFQAFAAVAAALLEAGVITAPAPRPKYDPYAQYGQYGSQYGQYGQQPVLRSAARTAATEDTSRPRSSRRSTGRSTADSSSQLRPRARSRPRPRSRPPAVSHAQSAPQTGPQPPRSPTPAAVGGRPLHPAYRIPQLQPAATCRGGRAPSAGQEQQSPSSGPGPAPP